MPPSALVREHVWANDISLLAIRPEHFDAFTPCPITTKIASIGC